MPNLKNSQNSGWLYVLKISNFDHKKRDFLINSLKKRGIEARPAFYPLNRMDPFKVFAKANTLNLRGCFEVDLPTFFTIFNKK